MPELYLTSIVRVYDFNGDFWAEVREYSDAWIECFMDEEFAYGRPFESENPV